MKAHLLSLALVGLAASASAATLSPEAALARLQSSAPGMLRAHGATPELRITKFEGGAPVAYLFDRGHDSGYLVLSADDTTTPLLGYSDSGTLPASEAELPDGLRYWLQSLASQSLRNNGVWRATARTARAPITPMTATRWNQDAPYNNDCPTIGAKRCYTGCVATAMSQVLKYYNYPQTGTGNHSYTWNYTTSTGSQESKTLSFDYGSTTFDWANMSDIYNSKSTAAQNAAVATLMYAAGVSVDMDYGTDESGAVSFDMVRALVENFGYDKGVQYHARDYYGIEEWEDMVYANLTDYGPVLYGGQSNDGGHQFVCDGYDGNGYFHFNWGWGGMSDGYFLLTALNPESQGIGGSTSGYNFQQDILTHLTPDQVSANAYEELLWEGDFTISTASAQLGGTVQYSGSFYSFSSGTLTAPQIGLLLTPAAGGEPIFVKYSSFQSLAPGMGITNGSFYVTLPTDLAEGEYKVQPAFKTAVSGEKAIPVAMGNTGSYTMTVSGTTATFAAVTPPTLTVANFALASEVYENMPFKLTATLTDNSDTEFYGTLMAAFIQDGQLVAVGEMSAVDLQAGESQEWEYVSSLSAASSETTITPGAQYDLYLCTEGASSLTPIAGPLTVTVNAASNPSLAVNSLSIPDGQPLNGMTATAEVGCSSGYFAGSLTLAIFPLSGGSAIGEYSSDFFTVSAVSDNAPGKRMANGTATVNYKFDFTAGADDTSYFGVLYANGQQISNPTQFHTAVEAGSNSTADVNPVVSTTYYSLTGVNLGNRRPASGICLQRDTHADGTVTVTRRTAR